MPLNGNGNHPKFPTRPDGSREIDEGWSFVETYKLMEKLLKTGKVKAIGVSNFSVKFLEKLIAETDIVPAVNQVCLTNNVHPLTLPFLSSHSFSKNASCSNLNSCLLDLD